MKNRDEVRVFEGSRRGDAARRIASQTFRDRDGCEKAQQWWVWDSELSQGVRGCFRDCAELLRTIELRDPAHSFVYTHSAGKSERYTIDNADEFPVHFPNVVLNGTPIHYQRRSQAVPLR
jgi:hypothetical protein